MSHFHMTVDLGRRSSSYLVLKILDLIIKCNRYYKVAKCYKWG